MPYLANWCCTRVTFGVGLTRLGRALGALQDGIMLSCLASKQGNATCHNTSKFLHCELQNHDAVNNVHADKDFVAFKVILMVMYFFFYKVYSTPADFQKHTFEL
jgi:hypothetical protein